MRWPGDWLSEPKIVGRRVWALQFRNLGLTLAPPHVQIVALSSWSLDVLFCKMRGVHENLMRKGM